MRFWADAVAGKMEPVVEAHRAAAELRHGIPMKVTAVRAIPLAGHLMPVYEVEITLEGNTQGIHHGKHPKDRHVQGQEQ